MYWFSQLIIDCWILFLWCCHQVRIFGAFGAGRWEFCRRLTDTLLCESVNELLNWMAKLALLMHELLWSNFYLEKITSWENEELGDNFDKDVGAKHFSGLNRLNSCLRGVKLRTWLKKISELLHDMHDN